MHVEMRSRIGFLLLLQRGAPHADCFKPIAPVRTRFALCCGLVGRRHQQNSTGWPSARGVAWEWNSASVGSVLKR